MSFTFNFIQSNFISSKHNVQRISSRFSGHEKKLCLQGTCPQIYTYTVSERLHSTQQPKNAIFGRSTQVDISRELSIENIEKLYNFLNMLNTYFIQMNPKISCDPYDSIQLSKINTNVNSVVGLYLSSLFNNIS